MIEIKKKVRNNESYNFISDNIFFSLFSYSIAAERDCSNPKKLHEKLICKMKGSSNMNESNLNQDEKLSKKKSAFGKIKEIITQDSLADAIKKAKE